MENVIHLNYDVESNNFVSAGRATEQVKTYLKKMGIKSEEVRRVAISMYEAEINMVIHANGGKVFADIYMDRIEIRLIDTGKGIPDIEKAFQPGFSTAPETVRELGFGAGMGLCNMRKYADVCEIESKVGEGTTVTLKVNFS